MKSTAGGPLGSKRTFWTSHSAIVGAAAAALSVISAGAASAQEAAPVEEDEVIVVTGSRIVRPDYEFSNPVASVDSQSIQRSGATNMTDFLADMPALVNSFDSEESADTEIASSVGLNLLNLRNLGTSRTLVLVDGRRHVSSDTGSAAVDTNTIPIDLVERVEVLTGGASAIYGADGVSGVVNFVMKDDFEGFRARAQTGWADAGGGETNYLSLTGGQNFAGGRGNFTLSFEMSTTEELNSSERDYSRPGNREVLVNDPADAADDPNVPDLNFFRDVRYFDTTPGGSIYTDFDWVDSLAGVDFLSDGTPWVDGLPSGDFTMIGGSGSLLDLFVDQMLPGLDRYSLNGGFRFDLNNNHRFFAEAKWVRTETSFEAQPTYDYFLFIPVDNPFIPAAALADALLPGNMGDLWGGVGVARDNFDLGPLTYDIERETMRTVFGLEGTVTEGMDYQVSLVWGQTETKDTVLTRNNERWYAAIDVIDEGAGPICRVDSPGWAGWIPDGADPTSFGTTFTPGAGECVPTNIFGDGSISAEARDWIMQELERESTLTQVVLQAYVNGDTERVFSLPAGPIGYALGVEYREEESEYITSDLERLAGELGVGDAITWSGEGTDQRGRFDVAELFAEIEVPILRDLPLAQELTLDAAVRFSDYSSVGSTDTWKVGATWRLNDAIMFRGTQAQAVRAPNISELYLPNTQTFGTISDPCDDDAVNLGTSYRLANCQAALAALNALNPAIPTDPNLFNNSNSESIAGRASGNSSLEVETADTLTYGVVLRPSFVKGLTLSLDYYLIELEDAIQLFDADTIVDYCYDLPQPNQFCDLIERTPTGDPSQSIPAGGIATFTTQYVNVASYIASGYDFSLRYAIDPANWGIERDIGRFALGLNVTKLDRLEFIESEIADPDNDVGDEDSPEWQAVFDATWYLGNWTFNYGLSWFDETRRVSENALAAEPDYVPDGYTHYSAREVHDLYAAYNFGDKFQIYGGVNNVGNQEPDRGSLNYPVGPLGRFFYVGGSASFESIGGLFSGD